MQSWLVFANMAKEIIRKVLEKFAMMAIGVAIPSQM